MTDLRTGLAATIAAARTEQAERILCALEEALPKGASLYLDQTCKGTVVTLFVGGDRTRCAGSSVRDALAQLTGALTLKGEG